MPGNAGGDNGTSRLAPIADGKNFMVKAWWMSIFPGVAIVLAGTGFGLTGDGLACGKSTLAHALRRLIDANAA